MLFYLYLSHLTPNISVKEEVLFLHHMLSYIVNHPSKICFCHCSKGTFESIHLWVALLNPFTIPEHGEHFPLNCYRRCRLA